MVHLQHHARHGGGGGGGGGGAGAAAEDQGLTLVHFSAQRKRFPWDRGYTWEFKGCLVPSA